MRNDEASPWIVKIDRAKEHVESIRSEVQALRRAGQLQLRIEPTDYGQIRRVVLAHPGSVPARMSAIVGDVLHNARSALDCIVVALATLGAGRPLTEQEERQLQFPVEDTPAKFAQRVDDKQLLYVPSDAVELIRMRQPFHEALMLEFSETSADWQRIVANDPLSRLHRLSVIDKHRRLHLGAWIAKDIFAGAPSDTKLEWLWAREPWGEPGEIGRWIIEGDPATEPEFGGEVDLVLAEDAAKGSDRPLADYLGWLVEWVAGWVLPPLADLLASG